jgi:hypothetical protein
LTSGIDLIFYPPQFPPGRMARPQIPEAASSYYPPRARWYSVFFNLGNALRRRMSLDRLALPREMKLRELAAGFLVPGAAVWLRGPKLWGQAALLLVFILWLGYPVAGFAFGLLLSLHCTGFVYYCNPLLAGGPFRLRLAFTLLVLLSIGLLLYLPARNLIQEHWLTPLRMNGRVIVVQRSFRAGEVRRGDWVAYAFDKHGVGNNYHGGWVVLHNGLSLGPVLALAGDQVTFSNNCFAVNGVWQANLPHMPLSGGLTVPENHWFIWPNLDISGQGDVGEARISGAILGLSDVADASFFGKPLRQWFWRSQILP